ncbi:HlyD family efflux transporter periplasmic adaptor subunit, partial [Pseudomonas sp. TNT11]
LPFSPLYLVASVCVLGASIWLLLFAYQDVPYSHQLWWQFTLEIDDSSLRAPIDGIIQLRLAEPGEVLGAGGRVLLLIDPEDQYMNLYLPASVTGALTVGSDARILLDALPDQSLPAKISFVAAKSQFTPKEVETRDERQKLVFRVKLRLTQPSAVPQAKPGMPGAGYVRTADIDWPANLQ